MLFKKLLFFFLISNINCQEQILFYENQGNYSKCMMNNENQTNDNYQNEKEIFAYFVSVFEKKKMDLIIRTLERIYTKKDLFLYHVDRRNKILYNLLKTKVKKYPNVFVISKFYVNIGSFMQVENILFGIQFLLKFSHWKWFINLSESDYPMNTVTYMKRVMSRYDEQDCNFVSSKKYESKYWTIDSHMFNLYKGSEWMILSNPFCKYLTSNDSFVFQSKEYFKNILRYLMNTSYHH